MYAKKIPPIYTAKASVFPLTASNENSSATSLLNSLTGIGEAPKSFSQEASINIVELATSRNTREAVAMEKLPSMGNRTIAELLIQSANRYKGVFEQAIKVPTNDTALRNVGGTIIKNGMSAKINKNGILEISFSSPDPNLVSPVSYVLIDKISQFYKDLKVKKARFDYDFTVRKMDSLQAVLNQYDRKAIRMANTTLFVPDERIEYTIPKENLINDKGRVVRQRDASANNREEALWRLQKVTPIIEILDKPDAPFEIKKTSAMMYAFIGLILGCLLGAFVCIADILYKYANAEINNAVFGHSETVEVVESTTTTTTASV
jgi:uncharacterized protein involved in exopolysaccharide biosynthesis